MMKKYKYRITYLDPTDEEARREKTWEFDTLREAKVRQEDLAIVWGKIPPKDIPIKKIEPTPKKKAFQNTRRK